MHFNKGRKLASNCNFIWTILAHMLHLLAMAYIYSDQAQIHMQVNGRFFIVKPPNTNWLRIWHKLPRYCLLWYEHVCKTSCNLQTCKSYSDFLFFFPKGFFKAGFFWPPSNHSEAEMKSFCQYFCMVPFVFQYNTKWNLGFSLNLILALLEVEG